MSSHRVQPSLFVQLRRFGRGIDRFMAALQEQLHGPVTRDDYVLMPPCADDPATPLWSPDPPSVPEGHVWTLPGVGTSRYERALWWGDVRSPEDNVMVTRLAMEKLFEMPPEWRGRMPVRITAFDHDGVPIGESGEPELVTSQSAEDQRAHEEDADD